MSYTKTDWVVGVTAINATNLNNLETQYDSAIAELEERPAIGSFTGANGDTVIATNATATLPYYIAENFTVCAGVTLTLAYSPTLFLVRDTFNLKGIISAVGLGGAGGGTSTSAGGDGGGVVLVKTRSFTGTGTVNAYGGAGGTPTGYNGAIYGMGAPGQFISIMTDGGRTGSAGSTGIGTGAVDGTLTQWGCLFPDWSNLVPGDIGGAGGGEGSGDNSSAYNYNHAGGGGAGCYGNGGMNNSAEVSASCTSGGGGGGGGAIIIHAHGPITAVTLNAYGGAGGNGYISHGGNGGGGGIVNLVTTTSSATVNVAGGAAGTKGAGVAAIDGNAGSAGISKIITMGD